MRGFTSSLIEFGIVSKDYLGRSCEPTYSGLLWPSKNPNVGRRQVRPLDQFFFILVRETITSPPSENYIS